MDKQAQATVKAPNPTITPLKSTLLQRTCACGASAGIDDLCSECHDKRLTSPRGPQHPSGLALTPPLVQQNSRSPAQAPTTGTNLLTNPNIGYNFAQVRVHAPAPRDLQTKLTVNQPGDVYEQEADQEAEQVMRMVTSGTSTAPATPGGDDEQEEESLMRKEGVSPSAQGPTSVPSIVDRVLSGGEAQPLETTTRAFMEPRFGYKFSQVRVHTDARAAESAQAVNALAYTVGRDIVFGAGQFAPGTSEGRRLLAHELTHVVQQGKGTGGIIQRQGAPKSGTVGDEKGDIAKPTSLPTSLPTVLPAATPAASLSTHLEPKPLGPPDGIENMRKMSKLTSGVLGLTSFKGYTPIFFTYRDAPDVDKWIAVVQSVSNYPPYIESYYPDVGTHKDGDDFLRVDSDHSKLIKQGEQEHIDDYFWAYNLSKKKIEDAINETAAEHRPSQETRSAAEESAKNAFLMRLPPQLRPPDLSIDSQHKKWYDPDEGVYNKLNDVTKIRDDEGWHVLREHQVDWVGSRQIWEIDKDAGREIGKHPSEKLLKDAFERLK